MFLHSIICVSFCVHPNQMMIVRFCIPAVAVYDLGVRTMHSYIISCQNKSGQGADSDSLIPALGLGGRRGFT